jgi:hypothetical protein
VPTDLGSKAIHLKGSILMRKVFGALALVALVSVPAFAQQPKKGDNASSGGGKVKVYDFSGDTIEGDLVKPEGTDLNVRDFAKHSSLIRIRKDFIPEIIKSAEDL